MTTGRLERIRDRLHQAFDPIELEVFDESHLHVGHVGAKSGKGHFRVLITADVFKGLPSIKRHRLVYDALGTMMESDIHALTVTARAPDQPTRKLED